MTAGLSVLKQLIIKLAGTKKRKLQRIEICRKQICRKQYKTKCVYFHCMHIGWNTVPKV